MEHITTLAINYINTCAISDFDETMDRKNADDDDDADDYDNVGSPDWVSPRHPPMTQGFTRALAPRLLYDDDNEDYEGI